MNGFVDPVFDIEVEVFIFLIVIIKFLTLY